MLGATDVMAAIETGGSVAKIEIESKACLPFGAGLGRQEAQRRGPGLARILTGDSEAAELREGEDRQEDHGAPQSRLGPFLSTGGVSGPRSRLRLLGRLRHDRDSNWHCIEIV